jgi:hypothetical protein
MVILSQINHLFFMKEGNFGSLAPRGEIGKTNINPSESLDAKFFKLKETKLKVGDLLVLASKNPKYESLLKKAITLAVAVNGYGRMKILNWPNVDPEGDSAMILEKRIQKEGIDFLGEEFSDISIDAHEIMSCLSQIGYGYEMQGTAGEVRDAVIGTDWHDRIEDMLLAEKNN